MIKKEGSQTPCIQPPSAKDIDTNVMINNLKINNFSLNDMQETEEIQIPFNPAQILASCQVDPTKEIDAPPAVIEIYNNDGKTSPTLTAGNFSLLIGKAKSRKTFLQTSIVASAVSNGFILGRIKGVLPQDKNIVMLFDTEQSEYHLNRTVRRACRLVNNINPDNFKAFGLRKFKPSERRKLIEFALYNTPNIGFVAIDGLRDLLTRGINDEEEATEITSDLLKWTAELNIHILLVLHQNKGDLNARGHVGTEAVNKAESVISVSLSECKDVSIVEAEFCRDLPFEPFAFTIDGESGLPIECDMPNTEKKQVKQSNPELMADEIHVNVLNTIYRSNSNPTFEELRDGIIYGFQGSFGQTKCRQFITHYLSKGWIEKNRDGQKVIYKYKRAIF